MMSRAAVVLSIAALTIACSHADHNPVTPDPPPQTGGYLSASSIGIRAAEGRDEVLVSIRDACDPETFNAKSISCVRAGGVTFDNFIEQLTRFGFIGGWRFAPGTANVQVGQTFVARNIGGETHTFTQVAEFGGGIVPFLNDLLHLPTVAPECDPSVLDADDFVAPGGTYRETIGRTGTLKFQCCIHPWMRLEASSR